MNAQIFFLSFDEDHDFWWTLYMEEINHASLLKSGKDFLKTYPPRSVVKVEGGS